MQDAQKTDFRAQMLRISRNLKEGGCAGLEQEAVEDLRIVLAKRIQLMRDAEDYVK